MCVYASVDHRNRNEVKMGTRYDEENRRFHAYNNGGNRGGNFSHSRSSMNGTLRAPTGFSKGTSFMQRPCSSSTDHRRRTSAVADDKVRAGGDSDRRARGKTSHVNQNSKSPRVKEFGDWSEQFSSSGKRYFYNKKTEVSQWEKPTDWQDYERRLAVEQNTSATSPQSSSSQSNRRRDVAQTQPSPGGEPAGSPQLLPRTSVNKREVAGGGDYYDNLIEAKRRRLQEAEELASAAPVKKCVDQNDNGVVNAGRTSSGLDLSKLPDLLVRVAERLNVQRDQRVAAERAQKGREEAAAALQKAELAEAAKRPPPSNHQQRSAATERPPTTSVNVEYGASSTAAPRCAIDSDSVATAKPQQRRHQQRPSTSSVGSSSRSSAGSAEQQQQQQSTSRGLSVDPPPPPPPPILAPTHARFYNATTALHASGWAADHFESQAFIYGKSASEHALHLSDNSVELKSVRSLVRTAEIHSTLLRQKLLIVSQQIRQLSTNSPAKSAHQSN